VAVTNGVAYLSGTVDESFQTLEAQDVASRIKGVLLVRNRLKAEPDVSFSYYATPYDSYAQWPYYNEVPYYQSGILEPQSYLSDEQIKKNIERAFFWSPFVDSDDIKVTVNGGVATLTGTVGTWIGWWEASKDVHKSGAGEVLNRVTVKKGAWWW
jgi:osmotically-inducible protein OsmY